MNPPNATNLTAHDGVGLDKQTTELRILSQTLEMGVIRQSITLNRAPTGSPSGVHVRCVGGKPPCRWSLHRRILLTKSLPGGAVPPGL